VPFYVRAGKGLPTTALEAVAELRCPPRLLFAGADCAPPAPNLVRFWLGHDPGVSLTVQAKVPGKRIVTKPVDVRVDFDTSLGWQQQAYERLLDDALDGDARRFAREDMVEQAWRVVAPALTGSTPPHPIRVARGDRPRRRSSPDSTGTSPPGDTPAITHPGRDHDHGSDR